jgi:hypothetical protein
MPQKYHQPFLIPSTAVRLNPNPIKALRKFLFSPSRHASRTSPHEIFVAATGLLWLVSKKWNLKTP